MSVFAAKARQRFFGILQAVEASTVLVPVEISVLLTDVKLAFGTTHGAPGNNHAARSPIFLVVVEPRKVLVIESDALVEVLPYLVLREVLGHAFGQSVDLAESRGSNYREKYVAIVVTHALWRYDDIWHTQIIAFGSLSICGRFFDEPLMMHRIGLP
jgi:hypothetical protein